VNGRTLRTPRQVATAKELGALLRRGRTAARHTTRSIAAAVAVSAARISHWETGQRVIPREQLDAVLRAVAAPPAVCAEALSLWQQVVDDPVDAVVDGYPLGMWRELSPQQQDAIRRVMAAMLDLELPG
jgi:transcriptional regulator with XRE-family HTH domain